MSNRKMNNQPEKVNPRKIDDFNPLEYGVSVVVFTFNSEKRIADTLNAVTQLPVSECPAEIILVDNNSSDTTVEIAEKILKQQSLPFKLILQHKPGLFYSRVAGIKAASMKYFIFVDDDNHLQGDWINGVCSVLNERRDTGLVGGVNTEVLQAEEPEWWSSQKHAYAVGRANLETGLVNSAYAALWGAGLSGRTAPVRHLYTNAPFWLVGRTEDTLLAGEDSELCYWMRLIGFGIYQSEMKLYHVIESRKLTENYLLGIHKGFRISDHYLLQYRIALTNNTWFWQNVKYGVFLKIKWLMYPFRILLANSKVQKLVIRTKTPTLKELFSFWWNLRRMRGMYRTIVNKAADIQKSIVADRWQDADNRFVKSQI